MPEHTTNLTKTFAGRLLELLEPKNVLRLFYEIESLTKNSYEK